VANISYWWEELGGPPSPRRPLTESIEADVCIVGAGYTGLWTAYSLLDADPSLRVVVLEREFAGFGASGRNGGWLLGDLAGSRRRWTARSGPDQTLAFLRAIQGTVDEVARVVQADEIDCDLVKGGTLSVARTETALATIRAQVDQEHGVGLNDSDLTLLDLDALNARVRIRDAVGASYSPHCARIQPAKLVRGLANAVEKRGATIYEHSPVTEIATRRACTPAGSVHARWIVHGTEAYTAKLSGLRRTIMPVNSAMIITEPLPPEAWTEIGWDNSETILNVHHLYTYLQKTVDGRIAIGGRGIPYRYASKTAREGPLPQRTQDELRRELLAIFGPAADTQIAAAWHGVLGITRTWEPSVCIDHASGLAWAFGYVGEGVAAANLAGRTLTDLILARDTDLTRLPWVTPPERRWELEPIRYLGIHLVYSLLRAADRSESRTRQPSRLARLANALAGRNQ
jgi:glycine/D-amino acid oxidase-like deaminating enzyme